MNDTSALIGARNHHITTGKTILAKAKMANRDLTEHETTEAHRHINEARKLNERIRQANGDTAVKDAIRDLTTGAGEAPQWASKAMAGSSWAKSAAGVVANVAASTGQKALISGAYDVGSVIQPGIDQLPSYPRRVLDLLVGRRAVTEGNTFSYLRQTVRTNNAAPVADGAVKPTSIFTFAEVEDRCRVIAHLSEPVPLRLLSDIAELNEFLASEMEEGLLRAVEQQVLSGDGTGEAMTGLLETSGLVTQAWSTDLLTTLRKAATALEVAGEVPSAWLIHPSDVEVLDLLQDDTARGYFGGPSAQLGQSAPVWSLPIVRSTAIAAGTAVLGDWSKIQLVVREDTKLDVDTAGDLFTKNQALLRVEGRFGNAVLRPGAFCTVATTSGV